LIFKKIGQLICTQYQQARKNQKIASGFPRIPKSKKQPQAQINDKVRSSMRHEHPKPIKGIRTQSIQPEK
jgi:hypothetical protein